MPGFDAAVAAVRTQLARLEGELGQGPWFAGEKFSLVDAIFAPSFRYCELFEQLAGLDITEGLPRVKAWANALLARPSVRNAAPVDFTPGVKAFLPRFGEILAEKAQAACVKENIQRILLWLRILLWQTSVRAVCRSVGALQHDRAP